VSSPVPQRDGLAVTVVSIYFAPDSTGIAPYTTEYCDFLSDAGMKVDAVVGIPHYPQWHVDPAYRRMLLRHEARGNVGVHRVRHFVPKHQNVLSRGLYEGSFGVLAAGASRRLKPDVVVAVTPNITAVPVAHRIARRLSVPLLVVVQDLVGLAATQSGIDGGHRFSDMISKIEARWISQASKVAIITEAFRKPLETAGVPAHRIVRLPNHSHIEMSSEGQQEARLRLGWPLDPAIAVHTGNMGMKQDLGNVLEAARLIAQRSDTLIMLVGDGNRREELEKDAAHLDNVRIVPPVDSDLYPSVLAAADVLLINERPSVLDMSMPSKLTSYLTAGRPIVAAVHSDGAAAVEIRACGGGVVIPAGQPLALADALLRLLGQDQERRSLGNAARTYALEHLSREGARARTVELVRSLARERSMLSR
jgi:colanic acid biosynthesis glycosyl transferase WcaI